MFDWKLDALKYIHYPLRWLFEFVFLRSIRLRLTIYKLLRLFITVRFSLCSCSIGIFFVSGFNQTCDKAPHMRTMLHITHVQCSCHTRIQYRERKILVCCSHIVMITIIYNNGSKSMWVLFGWNFIIFNFKCMNSNCLLRFQSFSGGWQSQN